MSTIPFVKYTHCGNSFVIVDETSQPYIPEHNKVYFAQQASDVAFGIGSDNLLVIQPFQASVLQNINHAYNYWEKLPTSRNCNYIFRFFDRNEALTCGNGLLCISSYLYKNYGVESTLIMTEVPLAQPKVISIGIQRQTDLCWCNLGYPRRAPENIVPSLGIEHYRDYIDIVYNLKIGFRSHDLHSISEDTPLILSGYLIFTGEPHMVIFPDECMPPELANTLFLSPEINQGEKRRSFGSWLISHIGAYINKHYQTHFPVGISINFARIVTNNTIQYRTYERGNNYETLACGTGAVAVAYVANKLQMITDHTATLLPHRCSWHKPNARLYVEATNKGWLLLGNPSMLFTGQFISNEQTLN